MARSVGPLPGYAAVAREDVADAKRRRPDSDLTGYARERGLEWLDDQPAAGFLGAMPGAPGYNFNVARGREDGWREWVLFHEVLPWPAPGGKPQGSGTFYGTYYSQPGWWKYKPKDLLFFVPVVGNLMTFGDDELPAAVGVPCTVAAVQVPEAAWVRDFIIDNFAKNALPGPDVDSIAPGWWLSRLERTDIGIAAHELLPLIREWQDQPLFELVLRQGVLIARRNGYAADREALDRLVHTVLRAADALRELATGAPADFAQPLPAPQWPAEGYSAGGHFPPQPWREALHALAADVGMTLEDPWAYMRAFPQQPVPGRAFAVLRDADRRLVLHAERDIGTHNVGRTALVEATDAPDSPRSRVDGVDHAVRGGLRAAWIARSATRMGDCGDLPKLFSALQGQH